MPHYNIDRTAIRQFIDHGTERAADGIESKVANVGGFAQVIEPTDKTVPVISHNPCAPFGVEQQPAGIGLESLDRCQCFRPERNNPMRAGLVPVIVKQIATNQVACHSGDVAVSQPTIDREVNRSGELRRCGGNQGSQLFRPVESPGPGRGIDPLFARGGLNKDGAISNTSKPTLPDCEVEERTDAHHELLPAVDGLSLERRCERGEVFGADGVDQGVLADKAHERCQDLPIVTHGLYGDSGRLPLIEGIADVCEGNRVSALRMLERGELPAEDRIGILGGWRGVETAHPSGLAVDPFVPSTVASGQSDVASAPVNFVTHFVTHDVESIGKSSTIQNMSTPFKTVAYSNFATPGRCGYSQENNEICQETPSQDGIVPYSQKTSKSFEIRDPLLRKCYAPEGLSAGAIRFRRYYAKNAHKVKARNFTRAAVANGKLHKPVACSECGSTVRVEIHHKDYSLPIDVEFLCRRCHKRRHIGYVSKKAWPPVVPEGFPLTVGKAGYYKRIGGECRYIAGMVSPEIAIQKYNQKLGELLSPSPRRQA